MNTFAGIGATIRVAIENEKKKKFRVKTGAAALPEAEAMGAFAGPLKNHQEYL
jgi:hypothetical protein